MPELPTFQYAYRGIAYDVRVTSSTKGSGATTLSLDAFVGGEHTTTEGDLRRYIYTADTQRLAALDRAEVPNFVAHLLDVMVSLLGYYNRWHGLLPDAARTPNLLRIADVQVHNGDVLFRVNLPDPSGPIRFDAPLRRPVLLPRVAQGGAGVRWPAAAMG